MKRINRTYNGMKAYLLYKPDGKLWMVFGENAVSACQLLIQRLGAGDVDDFSVGGSWPITEPIDISQLWPHFTFNPPPH